MWWIDRTEFLAALQHAEAAQRAGRSRQAVSAYLRAVRLYRGPLFEDDRDGDWYLPEQRRLGELYLQAVECLAEIHLEQQYRPCSDALQDELGVSPGRTRSSCSAV